MFFVYFGMHSWFLLISLCMALFDVLSIKVADVFPIFAASIYGGLILCISLGILDICVSSSVGNWMCVKKNIYDIYDCIFFFVFRNFIKIRVHIRFYATGYSITSLQCSISRIFLFCEWCSWIQNVYLYYCYYSLFFFWFS